MDLQNYYTNKDEEFLKESDLVIFWAELPVKLAKKYAVIGGSDEFSRVDIPKRSEKLPLLLARLAYVFEIYDEKLKNDGDFEDFVEIVLKSVRVKQNIQKHTTTLEEIAGLLYLIDNAKKISFIIGEIDEVEMENLMSFVKMLDKEIGIFAKTPLIDVEFYGI
ncbi:MULTISPECIES: hypothetical protein [unclassified Lebetimonas]|uniref:hypothetical protein n=1 Tax=unclassified Lebetimonas TaxID=2648158 RepID=UPI0004642DFB|nr:MULTISPECIES: hypothetical protein [unclassified Lebetimonas]